MQKEEVTDLATEQTDLEDFFLDCVHSCRKHLRYKLVSYHRKDNLLQAYLNTVKSGDPKDVERFSAFEKQKLAELLVTNKELLQNIFDKMFRNREGYRDDPAHQRGKEIGIEEILNMLKGDFSNQNYLLGQTSSIIQNESGKG